MRIWRGIELNEAANGAAALMAINTRFYVDGELQRRNGLVRTLSPTTAYTLTTIIAAMPINGVPSIIQTDSNGTVSILPAPAL